MENFLCNCASTKKLLKTSRKNFTLRKRVLNLSLQILYAFKSIEFQVSFMIQLQHHLLQSLENQKSQLAIKDFPLNNRSLGATFDLLKLMNINKSKTREKLPLDEATTQREKQRANHDFRVQQLSTSSCDSSHRLQVTYAYNFWALLQRIDTAISFALAQVSSGILLWPDVGKTVVEGTIIHSSTSWMINSLYLLRLLLREKVSSLISVQVLCIKTITSIQ